MKLAPISSMLTLLALAGIAHAACNGTLVTKETKDGKQITVCNDGRYASCVRDGQRMGYTAGQARSYCDRLNLKH